MNISKWFPTLLRAGFPVFILLAIGSGNSLAQTNVAARAKDAPPVEKSLSDQINEQLPAWVRIGGEYRLRWEGSTGMAGKPGNDDGFLLSRARLDLTFKFAKHWTIFLQGQDAHGFGIKTKPTPAIHQDAFDLRQAYIEWQQQEKQGWLFRFGRQELNYDDQRLVGALNWTNTARSFDAVKVAYRKPAVAVEAFAASVVGIDDGHFDRHRDGNNFYGLHASFPKNPKAQLSTFLFWKTEPLVKNEAGKAGDADSFTLGFRLQGKLKPRIEYAVEPVWQRGKYAKDSIRAFAFHSKLIYGPWKPENRPKLQVQFNHASGDKTPGDGVRGTFDQLYPTGHALYGVLDQVGWRNMNQIRLGTVWQPNRKLKIEADYLSGWLAQSRDGLYQAGGALVARLPQGSPSKHVAQEVDLQMSYAYKKWIAFGGGFAHWIPGGFWKAATPGAARTFGYTFVTYRF